MPSTATPGLPSVYLPTSSNSDVSMPVPVPQTIVGV
jgi:hypothetical protein